MEIESSRARIFARRHCAPEVLWADARKPRLRVGATLTEQQTKSHLSFAKRMKIKHGGQPDLAVEAVEALERGELAIEPNADLTYPLSPSPAWIPRPCGSRTRSWMPGRALVG